MGSLLFSLAALFALSALSSAWRQTIRVKGETLCNNRRIVNVVVQLMEHDTLDPNDMLMEDKVDRNGYFEVTGEEDEIFTLPIGSIEPFVRFIHDCDLTEEQKKKGCKRHVEFDVPNEYINGVYDMAYVQLRIEHAGETIKC